MKQALLLRINGQDYPVETDPQRTLLEVLREELGLTGTKRGCDDASCGACTVLVDSQAVYACILLAAEAEGKEIVTIEGLAQKGKLHPLQQAFVDYGAIQCGFCTPGMIMAAQELLDKNPHPQEAEVREALSGTLCRCTAYFKIIEAVLAAGQVGK